MIVKRIRELGNIQLFRPFFKLPIKWL